MTDNLRLLDNLSTFLRWLQILLVVQMPGYATIVGYYATSMPWPILAVNVFVLALELACFVAVQAALARVEERRWRVDLKDLLGRMK